MSPVRVEIPITFPVGLSLPVRLETSLSIKSRLLLVALLCQLLLTREQQVTQFLFRTPLAGIPAGTDVEFKITDADPFFATFNSAAERLFNPAEGGYPYTLTQTVNIDDFTGVATVPTVENVDRVGNDTLSAGGANDKVAWTVTFDQDVINVDTDDFQAIDEDGKSIASDTNIEVTPISDSQYTVTATLPTTDYDTDEQIDLHIDTSDIMGEEGITSASEIAFRRLAFWCCDNDIVS